MRLLEVGDEGCARILHLLRRVPAVPCAAMIADSFSLWPEAMHDGAREIIRDNRLDPQVRFLLSLNFAETGEVRWRDCIVDALLQPVEQSWMQPADMQRLRRTRIPDRQLPLRLIESPHPVAYVDSVMHIVGASSLVPEQDAIDALSRFLMVDEERPEGLRHVAATWLYSRGNDLGLSIRLREIIKQRSTPNAEMVRPKHVEEFTEIVVLSGPKRIDESWFLDVLEKCSRGTPEFNHAAARLMENGVAPTVRKAAAYLMTPTLSRTEKLRRVAEAFAWGVPIGRELTGRVFRVEMIGDDDLGYTRLNENRIYISPLPILRQVKHGREIVEGSDPARVRPPHVPSRHC